LKVSLNFLALRLVTGPTRTSNGSFDGWIASAFFAEQVSVILQNNNALKYKDRSYPTISCFIGEHKIEKALLGFGASVNLFSYLVFKSLNLGELKPTSVIC
jgi:hypothetical protein